MILFQFSVVISLLLLQLCRSLQVSSNVERRQALALISGGAASTCAVVSAQGKRSRMGTTAATTYKMTIDQAVTWIDQSCDREYLSAVVESGYRFLYRGVVDSASISVRTETPDLLLPETYGNDAAALAFFTHLESTAMKDCPVKPSTGHLATSSRIEASKWGQAASIWPLQGTDFAWFKDTSLFYPRSIESLNDDDDDDTAGIICNGRNCGKESLDDALMAKNAEVLFSAKPFLVIPATLDRPLRDSLRHSFLL